MLSPRSLRIGAVAATVFAAIGPRPAISSSGEFWIPPARAVARQEDRSTFENRAWSSPSKRAGHEGFFDPTLPTPMIEWSRPAEAGRVRGGDEVWVRWSAIQRQVEEFEILISIDGGRSFRLRVSPDLGRGETRYAWRVPNLEVAHARLRIRVGERGHEIKGPIGGEFRIEADRSRPREPWLFHDRGWWEGGPARWPVRLAGRPGDAELRVGDPTPPFENPTRSSLAVAPAREPAPRPARALPSRASRTSPSSLESRSQPIRE